MTKNDSSTLPSLVADERRVSFWLLTITAVVLSVATAWAFSAMGHFFALPEEFMFIPDNASADYMNRYHIAYREMISRNYLVEFAAIGSVLGLAIGAIGGVRNRVVSLIASLVSGGIAGALGGFMLGLGAVYCIEKNLVQSFQLLGVTIEPMVRTSAMQCAAWAFIGLAIGCSWTLAVWGVKRIVSGIEGGLLGGLLAGVVHSLVAAFLFPNSNSLDFVPEPLTERLLWAGICGLSVALGLAYSVSGHAKKAAKTTIQSPG